MTYCDIPLAMGAEQGSATLDIHFHIMAAGDSGILVRHGSCWGDQRDAIALKPLKADVPPVGN